MPSQTASHRQRLAVAAIVVSARVARAQGAETAAFDAIALLLRLRRLVELDGADPHILRLIDTAIAEFDDR